MEKILDELYERRFDALMSSSYHAYLEYRYSSFVNLSNFLTIALSAAATFSMIDLIPDVFEPYRIFIVSAFTFLVAVLNAIILSAKLNEKISEHNYYRRQWTLIVDKIKKIESDIENNRVEKTKALEIFDLVRTDLTQLQSNEPAQNDKLLDKMYVKTCKQLGKDPQ